MARNPVRASAIRNSLFIIIACLAFGLWPAGAGAQAQPPRPVLVQAFLELELLDSACWRYVTAFGIVEYENICSADSKIALVKATGKPVTYAIPPQGKLVFLGGNTVHIFGRSRGSEK